MKSILLLLLLLNSVLFFSQERIKDIEPCVNSLTNSVKGSSGIRLKVLIRGDSVLVSDDKIRELVVNTELTQWVGDMVTDSIKGYKIVKNGVQYFAFSSLHAEATSLMINFTQWIIYEPSKKKCFQFISLSSNINLIQIQDQKKIIIYRIDYSDEFLRHKNFDQVSFRIEKLLVNDGTAKIISIKQSMCK